MPRPLGGSRIKCCKGGLYCRMEGTLAQRRTAAWDLVSVFNVLATRPDKTATAMHEIGVKG